MRICVLAVMMTSAFAAAGDADRKDWVSIFNGKNLEGWVVKLPDLGRGAVPRRSYGHDRTSSHNERLHAGD